MTDIDLDTLRKLDEIGGWVEVKEIIHHCGPLGPTDLMEAERQGLVEQRCYFSLTDAGRDHVTGGIERLLLEELLASPKGATWRERTLVQVALSLEQRGLIQRWHPKSSQFLITEAGRDHITSSPEAASFRAGPGEVEGRDAACGSGSAASHSSGAAA